MLESAGSHNRLVYLLKLEPDDEDFRLAPPFGILYLASSLEQEGFRVKLYHEKGTPENIKPILEDILNNQPLFVGISTLTGPSLLPSRDISMRIKKSSPIPLVWGGLHPTMLPEQTLSNEWVDVVAVGEGEETIAELARSLMKSGLNPGNLQSIKGIGYKENGKMRMNPPRPFIADLDRYEPSWDHLNFERYVYNRKYFYSEMGSKLPGDRIGAFITSRGCPWRCGYCYNQFVNRRHFRAHSAQKAVQHIGFFRKEHRLSAIIIEDDDFYGNKARALEIIRKLDVPWSSSIRANYVTQWGEDFVRELSERGCVELRIGGESGSPRVLDVMQKDIKLDDIYRTVDLCSKHNIMALFNFMIGIPGETWTEMLETFRLMDDLERKGSGRVRVFGPSVYTPWPGTALYDLAVKQGYVPFQKMEDWAVGWRTKHPLAAYVDRRAKFVSHYRILGLKKDLETLRLPIFARVLKFVARKRWEKRYFRFPLDYHVPNLLLSLVKFLRLRKIARALYS